jgi:hypothetical protein
VDGRDEQQEACRLGELGDAGGKGSLQAVRERQRACRQVGDCGERELGECERVARRLAQQPAAGGGRELRARGVEQRGGGAGVERSEHMLGQSGVGER